MTEAEATVTMPRKVLYSMLHNNYARYRSKGHSLTEALEIIDYMYKCEAVEEWASLVSAQDIFIAQIDQLKTQTHTAERELAEVEDKLYG